jgi:predicted Zn-dependent peptidase
MTTSLPALTTPRAAKGLRATTAVLENGLRVVAVRKPGVPIVELRLRMPFLSPKPAHPAQANLLADAMLTGAGGLDRAGLAATIQGLGGDVSVSTDADRLVIGANVLSVNLRRLLGVVATVLTEPTYDRGEVAGERDRLVEKLSILRARPGVVASEALALRMWGEHPYALDLPQPEAVAAVTPAQLRALHRALVRPDGATLVLVGDVATGRLVDLAQAAFAGWTGRVPKPQVPALPAPPGGPLEIIDRPGAVQSSLRMGGVALTRTDPGYPALQLANLVFGGYFTSRWTKNLREDKGYTYGPHSRVEHHALGSTIGLNVEVATEVTAPAVLETRYELGRIATLPVTDDEVDSARQYAIGTLALSTATQSGLASTLAALSAFGLGLDWILEHPGRLQAVTVDDVSAAAARFLAPSSFTSVIVGDAGTISGPLATLGAVDQ